MTEQEVLTAVLGASLAIVLIIMMIFLASMVLIIASMWKIFTKAGEEGWKAIIPLYNSYVLLSIIKVPQLFWGWLVCIIVANINLGTFSMIGLIGTIVISIITCVKVAKAFGKSGGFAIGLIFLPAIFYPILAFGSSKYQVEAN